MLNGDSICFGGMPINIVAFGDPFLSSSIMTEQILEKASGIKRLKVRGFELSTRKAEGLDGVSEYWGDPKEIIENLDDAEVLIVHMGPVTSEVVDAGSKLKLIGCCRSGPANVDIAYVSKKGIPIIYTPGRNAQGVADLTIGLIIAESRGIARADAAMKAGIWSVPEVGVELWGKTLGVIGLGNVGSMVAYRAKNGFGMRVLAYDPYVLEKKAKELGARLVDLGKLLRESDFVTIHSRAMLDEKPQITAEHLALMKSTAYLVNTSRGSVLDEQALYEALKNGKIAGAALDVYAHEPIDPQNPLLKLDNVTLTPHVGGVTREVPLRAAEIMAEDVARFLKGEKLRNVLSVEVFKR